MTLATTLVVVVMAVLVAFNMRDGFSRYLLQAELNRYDHLSDVLVSVYDSETKGWPQFENDSGAWRDFVGQNLNLQPRKSENGGNKKSKKKRNGKGKKRGKDGGQIGERIFLLDADKEIIVASDGYSSNNLTRPIFASDSSEGASPIGWVGMSAPREKSLDADEFYLSEQYLTLMYVSLFAVIVSIGISILLARQFLAPIRALEAATKNISNGAYHVRIPNTRKDELGRVIDNFNSMAASLEDAKLAEERWVSDTAHELKTPLFILRGEIEAVLDKVRMPSEQTFQDLHTSVERLTRLVDDINTISSDREGSLTALFFMNNVSEIAAEAAEAVKLRLDETQIDITLNVPSNLLIQCDGQRIRQVFDNLLENAVRYTDPPGQIELTGLDNGEVVQFVVQDSPPAPRAEDFDKLFNRLFRAEPSRSRALGGSGLGLSVCKSIVQAHGGTIVASPSKLGGLRIVMTLPKKG